VQQEFAQKPKNLSLQERLSLTKKLGAEYFLAGTITKIGATISIDAQLVSVNSSGQPLPVFVQSPDLDGIIPQLSTFAQNVKEKIIADLNPALEEAGTVAERAAPKKATAYSGRYETTAEEPEELEPPPEEEPPPPVRRRRKRPVPVKPKKPVFKMPPAPFEPSPWFAYDIKSKPCSTVCCGDVNGDGKKELILAGQDELRIYQVKDKALIECAAIKITMDEHIVHVDAADMNGNKTDELYVSSYEGHYANSFVVEFSQGDYKRISDKPLKYFFRVYRPVDTDALLIGQEAGISSPFSGTLFQFEWKDGSLISREEFLMPGSHGIYSFTEADVDGDESRDYLVFDKGLFTTNHQFTIFSTTGRITWRDTKKLGGSPNFFNKFVVSEMPEQEFTPPRIICDYFRDTDALPTVIVAKNSRGEERFIDKLMNYTQGEVQCLAWNGTDLATIWTSSQVHDYITDYIVADIDNDGQKELCMVSVSGEGVFGKATNRITVYRTVQK